VGTAWVSVCVGVGGLVGVAVAVFAEGTREAGVGVGVFDPAEGTRRA
jgi:hypothetical protein